ncbi:MAG: hypothetical protein ACLTS1_19390 [Coprococcus sp.]
MHEGCDLMASTDVPVSIRWVRHDRWGRSIGKRLAEKRRIQDRDLPHRPGAYISSLCTSWTLMEVIGRGTRVKAGDIIGFMGNTGYGPEGGRCGMFATHLHLGIYLYPTARETSY